MLRYSENEKSELTLINLAVLNHLDWRLATLVDIHKAAFAMVGFLEILF